MIRVIAACGMATVSVTTDASYSPDVHEDLMTRAVGAAMAASDRYMQSQTIWSDDGSIGDLTGITLGDDEDEDE